MPIAEQNVFHPLLSRPHTFEQDLCAFDYYTPSHRTDSAFALPFGGRFKCDDAKENARESPTTIVLMTQPLTHALHHLRFRLYHLKCVFFLSFVPFSNSLQFCSTLNMYKVARTRRHKSHLDMHNVSSESNNLRMERERELREKRNNSAFHAY